MTTARAIRLLTLALTTLCFTPTTHAGHYTFEAVVAFVDPVADAPIADVASGDVVRGTLAYDITSPRLSQGGEGIYETASTYQLINASLTLEINGSTVDLWSGAFLAHVWDDDPIVFSPSDGLLFTNDAATGEWQFSLGNLYLPTDTFASDALPAGLITGEFFLDVFTAGGTATWLQTHSFTLNHAPEPASIALLVAGAAMMIGRPRRG